MRLLAAALPLLSVFVTETIVLAQEGARRRVEDESEKPVAVTVNPAALLIGRYGGNVEVVFARHHALVASGYAQAYTLTLARNMVPPEARDHLRDAPLTAGGEIGYRLYSGSRGADGLFVGPSFLLTPLVYPALVHGDTIELVPYHVPGVA